MEELKLWAFIAGIIIVLSTLIGAIYFESWGDGVTSSTSGTIVQDQGAYIGNGLHDLGHSLAIGWIFVGIVFFIIVCIIVYIKTRPKEPVRSYYHF
jgi:hypothetical protein